MKKSTNTIYPVILKVPDEKKSLSGKDRVLFLRQFARWAVILSAQKSGKNLAVLENDSNGAPIPVNGICWSLSHKPGYVAGVVSENPIGIDLEQVKPVQSALVKKVLDDNERQLTESLSDAFFYRCWTAKESVLKAAGVGLKGLSQCKIVRIIDRTGLVVSYNGREWLIEHVFFNSYLAALVTEGADILWTLPDQESREPF